MTIHHLEMIADVTIVVNDPDVIDRVVNNTAVQNGRGDWIKWRDNFYDLFTEEDVLNHLAFNAVRNGYTQANRLDGWADLDDDAAIMDVEDVTSL